MPEKGIRKHPDNLNKIPLQRENSHSQGDSQASESGGTEIKPGVETKVLPPIEMGNAVPESKQDTNNISVRTKAMWQDPVKRGEIMARMRAQWADPVIREQRIRKIQSSEAKKKRKETFEQRKGYHLQTQRMYVRMRELFGDNPYVVFERENGQLRKSPTTIAKEHNVSTETIRNYASLCGYVFVKHKIPPKDKGEWSPVWERNLQVIRDALAMGILDRDDILTSKQKEMLAERFASENGKPLFTVRQIAERRGITQQAIQEIVLRSIKRLKQAMGNQDDANKNNHDNSPSI